MSTQVNKKLFFRHKIFSSKLTFIIFCVIFAVLIFTRFSYPDSKSDFTWDQIDNAWAAKDIIYDHKLPLVGMQAKGNTGFYIGPYYYYLITPFYIATDLDPYASVLIAGVTSILTFLFIYFLIKDMFNEKIAMLAIFFDAFSFYIIGLDRTQWPVNFITLVSLVIFYSLYKIVNGNSRFMLLLAAAFGFSMHVHFTSVFYFPLILLCLPFFPRNKDMIKNTLYAIPIITLFLVPLIMAPFGKSSTHLISYLNTTFLGIHLRRFFQVAQDGFIEFEGIYSVYFLKQIGYVLFPLYLLQLFIKSYKSKKVVIVYLSLIWVLIPWMFFATYGGELSNYYFSITRPVVLIAISFILYNLVIYKRLVGCIIVGVFIIFYVYTNTLDFFAFHTRGVGYYREKVNEKIKNGEIIEFGPGNPESYFYFINKERYDQKK